MLLDNDDDSTNELPRIDEILFEQPNGFQPFTSLSDLNGGEAVGEQVTISDAEFAVLSELASGIMDKYPADQLEEFREGAELSEILGSTVRRRAMFSLSDLPAAELAAQKVEEAQRSIAVGGYRLADMIIQIVGDLDKTT